MSRALSSLGSFDEAGDASAALERAYRKVDRRLLAWYLVVLSIVRLEAHNIVNAAIMNIEAGIDIKHQLGDLTDVQCAAVLSAFHYPFIVCEPLSTLLLKQFTPRLWMGRIMISWGIIATCTGAVQNFGGLFACRFLLGLAEAGFLPGIVFHLSFHYPTDRLPLRVAILVALITFASALSGILSYAISFMNGICGLAGWRWLFLIEGGPAVLCGISTLVWLPNYPEDASMFTEAERAAILANRQKSQPSSKEQTWNWARVKALLKDWTLYTFSVLWICQVIGAYGVAMALPTVIHDLGLTSSASSQLLTIPPSIIGGCLLLAIAGAIQKKKLKPWLAAGALDACVLVCYIALVFVKGPITRYVLILLALVFAMGVLPILWPERMRATDGTTNAGLAIGITFAVSSLHGILAPHVYLTRFAPTYRTSFIISAALVAGAIVAIAVTKVLVERKYRRRAEVESEKD
ncbi:uncharacterized protein LTR77_002153 [Saxophila tyrrhenica]|uniref:Major facilitator superfamily (MFS) profile domain-containing protein n=1 Tax=Saxophila tyrrhenica TaxID=1690608 RepID=A0AAV9PKI5_9PEZI|nr:hypothetical protein LTR77_002153 [Saxophila tyrrhenica]